MRPKFNICFLIIFFISCNPVDCERSARIEKKNVLEIIVEKMPDSKSASLFYIIGRSPLKNEKITYREYDRWLCNHYEFIDNGDTLLKKESELILKIHKKDTILSFDWTCEGLIYK